MIRTCRVTQLAQRLGFDLTDALTGDVELFADLFQSVVGIHINTKTHTQNFGFTRGQTIQHFPSGFSQAFLNGGVNR